MTDTITAPTATSSIIINDGNRVRIEGEIAAVEGAARVRKMDWGTLTSGAAIAEDALDGIPLKYRAGATAYVTTGETVARSYNGYPAETHVRLVRRAGGWAVAEVLRDRTRSGHLVHRVTITAGQEAALLAGVLAERRVHVIAT